MHIGLIGGIGPAATGFYYRGLVRRQAETPLELTIAHADMNVLLPNMAADAREAQARVFRVHVEQLAGAGAQVAAVTSIAGHFCFRELQAVSPLPLVSALTAVAEDLDRRGVARVGLLGSASVMATALYGALADFHVVLPRGESLTMVGREYLAMAAAQQATPAQQTLFFDAGAELCAEQGAELVLLAGTDLFLAFDGADPGFPVVDSAVAHIDALARVAASGPDGLAGGTGAA